MNKTGIVLRFISCGARGRVFDLYVWVCIASFTIFLSAGIVLLWRDSVKKAASLNNKLRDMLSIYKVLIEQGDPFSNVVVNVPRLRWLIGAFLLAGVVLSNAYKNTNVYNMITPRPPLPYETVKQLKADNFTIFSRALPQSIENWYVMDGRKFVDYPYLMQHYQFRGRHHIVTRNEGDKSSLVLFNANSEIISRSFKNPLINVTEIHPGARLILSEPMEILSLKTRQSLTVG